MMSDLSKMRDDGLHEVTEYIINEKGERVKRVTLRRRFTITVRTYESANVRKKNWSKFGKAALPGNDKITYVSNEDIFMEPPSPKKEKKEKEDKKEDSSVIKCRHCEGNHWTRKCPTLEENKVEIKVVDETKNETKQDRTYSKENNKKLLEKTTKTLRIEQLGKDVQEPDIYERFSLVGQVYNICIPRDYKSGGESRGFAFVEVRNIEDAKKIIERYDNFCLNHLRMKITML